MTVSSPPRLGNRPRVSDEKTAPVCLRGGGGCKNILWHIIATLGVLHIDIEYTAASSL